MRPKDGPAIAQSQNLPPWRWKLERAPRHENPGPALKLSLNSTQPGPLLEDGSEVVSVPVECLEASKPSLMPASQNQQVIPLTETPILEDGKAIQGLDSQCLESHRVELTPHSGSQEVIREDAGLILESVRTSKAPV